MDMMAPAPEPASTRNYPITRPEPGGTDPRFSFGLIIETADALTSRGYPPLTGADLVELQQALFRFAYGTGGAQ
jgi:hypothetical protein